MVRIQYAVDGNHSGKANNTQVPSELLKVTKTLWPEVVETAGKLSEKAGEPYVVDDVSLLSKGYHSVTGSFWDRVAKVLLPKDYLRLWLTGEHVAEMSDAAGTSWLDTGARDWSDDCLAATGLSRAQMPRLVEGSDVSGTLRDALAARWGLPKGVVVAGGGGDNAASGVGVGAPCAAPACCGSLQAVNNPAAANITAAHAAFVLLLNPIASPVIATPQRTVQRSTRYNWGRLGCGIYIQDCM